MPKFLHTADLHINALRKFDSYLSRVWGTLQEILSIARKEQVDVIVVAGDVCDRLDMTHAERGLLSSWLASSEIPILAISGNHDKRTAEIGDTCISYLASLRDQLSRHLVYDGPPTTVVAFGIRFILLPYQGWMDQELYLIIETLLAQVPEGDTTPNVVVMHEAVYGCANDAGLRVTKSNQIRLDESFPQVTYWALGDMHIHQKVLPNAWYSGAPHQTRFDDVPYKGVLIVDTDAPTEPKFVRIKSPELLVLEKEPADGWPSEQRALVQYVPDINVIASARLPANVQLHGVSALSTEGAQAILPTGDIFDGLEERLAATGLDPSLFPLAWRFAVQLAGDVGAEAKLPDKYIEKEPT